MKPGQRDPQIVNFRKVVNDAMVHPWEHMPEVQPPTVTGLIAYLKICHWDPHALRADGWRGDGYVLKYGNHRQFWLPIHATPEEQELLESFLKEPNDEIPCPFCKTQMDFGTELKGIPADEEHVLICKQCDIKISRYRRTAWTPAQIAEVVLKGGTHAGKTQQGQTEEGG
jgi:hypothetical protein